MAAATRAPAYRPLISVPSVHRVSSKTQAAKLAASVVLLVALGGAARLLKAVLVRARMVSGVLLAMPPARLANEASTAHPNPAAYRRPVIACTAKLGSLQIPKVARSASPAGPEDTGTRRFHALRHPLTNPFLHAAFAPTGGFAAKGCQKPTRQYAEKQHVYR